ncbi:hypothetical protein GUITHDRAFT_162060 [Guillardia theta CCMP2712]|uniref:Rab-GAP TBC domain-containing protein n=2 Tax=Guillardia theta TaxID=55529 RepID=L1JMG2_GUITC|nr:hypothetical protein GUITHDRAFT_162060 [Guillardia theta CCMP2712]EKX49642.1 hypothetical protein GUITHDRAFT_162060 [Guillardia theta CCMP2712]|eukprot:XP_005836622.1 hypothetical protein GUITHDRAFT_162060 [Guillardia theta CCMP2712]
MFRGKLFKAVSAGDENEVKRLIEERVDVNERGYRGGPLHEASRRGRTEIVGLLCASSADVNARDITKETPLHCAVSCGHLEAAKVLLCHGAEVNSQEFAGSTPLHSATTSLFIPSIQVRQQLIELLMAAGGDPSIRDKVRDKRWVLCAVKLRGGRNRPDGEFLRAESEEDRDADAKRDSEMRKYLELAASPKRHETDSKNSLVKVDGTKSCLYGTHRSGEVPSNSKTDVGYDTTHHKISMWIEGANKLFARSTNDRSKEMSVRDGNDQECGGKSSESERECSAERAHGDDISRLPVLGHGTFSSEAEDANHGHLFPSPSKDDDVLEQDPITVWREVVIPEWEARCNGEGVRKIWRQGISPYVRGQVWKNAIGNDLKLSEKDYQEMLRMVDDFVRKDQELLPHEREATQMKGFEFVEHAMFDDSSSVRRSEEKQGKEVFLEPPWIDHQTIRQIELDLDRTYTELGLFATDGVYHSHLRNVLRAYSCFRPSIGYVQGMGYIASIFLVYMKPSDVFVCMANLLHRHHFPAFLKVDIHGIDRFVAAFEESFHHHLPNLYRHLKAIGVDSRLFLVEWWMTGFCTVLPIDAASVVWDLLLLEGIASFVRITIGVLHELEDDLVQAPLEVCLTCLTHMEDFFETGGSQEQDTAQLRRKKSFKSVLDYANSLDISSDHFMRAVEKDRRASLSSSSKDVRQLLRQIAILAKEDEKAARERRNHLHDAILERWTNVWRAAKSWSDEIAGDEQGRAGETTVKGEQEGEQEERQQKDGSCPGRGTGEGGGEVEEETVEQEEGLMGRPQVVSAPLNAVVEAAEKLSREFQNAAEVFRGRHILPLASGATGMKIPWQLGRAERAEEGSNEEGDGGSRVIPPTPSPPPPPSSIAAATLLASSPSTGARKLEPSDVEGALLQAKESSAVEREVKPLVPAPAFHPRALKMAEGGAGHVQ